MSFLACPKVRPADLDRPDILDHHGAVAIDLELDGLVDPAPDVDVQLVVGADDVVVAHRNVSGRGKRRNLGGEQIVAELFERGRGRSGEELVGGVQLMKAPFDAGGLGRPGGICSCGICGNTGPLGLGFGVGPPRETQSLELCGLCRRQAQGLAQCIDIGGAHVFADRALAGWIHFLIAQTISRGVLRLLQVRAAAHSARRPLSVLVSAPLPSPLLCASACAEATINKHRLARVKATQP